MMEEINTGTIISVLCDGIGARCLMAMTGNDETLQFGVQVSRLSVWFQKTEYLRRLFMTNNLTTHK